MPVIVVANPKGGVGKSTLSTQIAGYLASRGHAVMLGDVDRQHRAVAICRPVVRLAPREVGAAERGEDAGARAGARHIHLSHTRVSVRRAQHLRVRHPGDDEIGHVARTARDLLETVDARDRPADGAKRLLAHRAVSATAMIASTIFR